MSLIRPSGREPASVYWMRRGAVLVVLITIIAIIVWFVTGRGESDPVADVAPTEAPAVVDGIGIDGTVETLPAGPRECADSDIVVRARAVKKNYILGESPELTLVIKNRGTAACVRDVGPKANEIEIQSGGYHVWSSDDCNAGKKSKTVTMQPGEMYAATLTWNGRRSQKGCPDPKGARAKPGAYQVIGRNGDVVSDERRFSISPRQAPQEEAAEDAASE
jgi:hypothetical protein